MFAVLTGVSILAATLLLISGKKEVEIQERVFLPIAILAGATLAVFLVREFKKLKIARLIMENPILHICTAVISEAAERKKQGRSTESIEVFISYFGVLLDDKIIKFNQEGIRLRRMEIGPDFISFSYGTEKRTQNIRILRPRIDPAALDVIARKFHFETGITPLFVE